MDFTVDAVYLISRKGGNAPFEFKARIPLGGGGGGGGGAKEDKRMSAPPSSGVAEGEVGEWWTHPYAPPPPPEVGVGVAAQVELTFEPRLERRLVSNS